MHTHLPPLVACVLALAVQALPAQAGPSVATVQVRVSTAGLDLTTEAGADMLLKRLSHAATEACGGWPDSSPLVANANAKFHLCRAKALAGAVEQADSAMLRRQFAATSEGKLLRLAQN